MPLPQRPARTTALALVACLATCPGTAAAQFVDDSRERYAFESPEGWAMAWVTSSTLLTAFGATPDLAPGSVSVSAELGSIPWLDEGQQRVGFGGIKDEDLNKSPAFGRIRGWIGLPHRMVLELAWTPPVRVDGAKTQDLFAAAIGWRAVEREDWNLSLRAHGQSGRARGDITCPRAIAGNPDPVVNRFRCTEPSDDRIDLRYHAVDATLGFGDPAQGPRGHATFGIVRFEPRVQVNARSPQLISIPQLSTSGTTPYLALGVTGDLAPRWELATEALYVPLDVRRDRDGGAESDAYWSLRVMLRWRWRA
jgi:hypothetical protein